MGRAVAAELEGEGARVEGQGGAVKMPCGEDYASIPSYGAFDPDDSDGEDDEEEEDGDDDGVFDRRRSLCDERRANVSPEQNRASTDVQDRGETQDVRWASDGALARSGTVASRVSYSVGDEAGMMAPGVPTAAAEEQREGVGEVNDDAPREKKTLGMFTSRVEYSKLTMSRSLLVPSPTHDNGNRRARPTQINPPPTNQALPRARLLPTPLHIPQTPPRGPHELRGDPLHPLGIRLRLE